MTSMARIHLTETDSQTAFRFGRRSVLPSLLAFLFLLQSWVFQTHIHPASAFTAAAAQAVVPTSTDNPDRDNPADCKICQADLVAGTFLEPGAIALDAAVFAGFVSLLAVATTASVKRAAHSWHGRAPPSGLRF